MNQMEQVDYFSSQEFAKDNMAINKWERVIHWDEGENAYKLVSTRRSFNNFGTTDVTEITFTNSEILNGAIHVLSTVGAVKLHAEGIMRTKHAEWSKKGEVISNWWWETENKRQKGMIEVELELKDGALIAFEPSLKINAK